MSASTRTSGTPRVLIVGGGFVGLYTALGLEKHLRPGEAEVTLVSPESFMTYQPFLPEAAAGNVEPRHVVVPLRSVLSRTRLVVAEAHSLDHTDRVATLVTREGDRIEVAHDHAVIAVGSVSRTLPIPGLEGAGIGFKTVAEAIHLRNHVISRLDAAEASPDEAARRRALTFVFVGGGYAGVEALAELEDLARDAVRKYASVTRADMRWVLVEAAGEILPEMAPGAGRYSVKALRARGIEVLLDTTLLSAEGGHIVLSNGEEFDTDTLVWTAGIHADPLTERLGLERDERGRLVTDEFLRVVGAEGVWAAGDCAAVPDLVTGKVCPPTAQYAIRQARRLARNLVATIRGE
ncbi:MAG TPA: FAD-dependent oxidoreductase, partial [Actinomycetota bacterium]|nr:FAD-dependent oxidoreductase [Actinomycetota bacterium]